MSRCFCPDSMDSHTPSAQSLSLSVADGGTTTCCRQPAPTGGRVSWETGLPRNEVRRPPPRYQPSCSRTLHSVLYLRINLALGPFSTSYLVHYGTFAADKVNFLEYVEIFIAYYISRWLQSTDRAATERQAVFARVHPTLTGRLTRQQLLACTTCPKNHCGRFEASWCGTMRLTRG